MSETFTIPNFSTINLLEQTFLDADTLIGDTQITALNTAGFVGGDFLLIGEIGAENAEVQSINSIASKIMTLNGSLSNAHRTPEHITKLYGTQIRLYRAPNVDGSVPSDSAFAYINVYATIQGDDTTSDVTDTSGNSAYWYKTTYYNPTTGNETSLALSVAVRGGNYGRLVSIESIRYEAGLVDNQNITDDRITEIRDGAENEVLGKLAAAGYTMPLQTANGAAYVPPLVEQITRVLAAGRLLSQEFAGSNGDSNNGAKKVKEATDALTAILKNEMMLLDTSGTMMARGSQVSGWPDDTTAYVGTDGLHGEGFQMRMSKRF